MQHSERLDRPVKSYQKWADRIPDTYRRSILDIVDTSSSPSEDPNCLARIKHYRGLVPMAQEVHKPIFDLTVADGAIGSHFYAVQEARKNFKVLATAILDRIALKK